MPPKRARRVPSDETLPMDASLAPTHEGGDSQARNVVGTLTFYLFIAYVE